MRSCGSNGPVFPHGRLLLDASRRNLPLLVCCQSLQCQQQVENLSWSLLEWVCDNIIHKRQSYGKKASHFFHFMEIFCFLRYPCCYGYFNFECCRWWRGSRKLCQREIVSWNRVVKSLWDFLKQVCLTILYHSVIKTPKSSQSQTVANNQMNQS